MKFRKKPIVVDAWRWNGPSFQAAAPEWALDYDLQAIAGNVLVTARQIRQCQDGSLTIPTLEGEMRANPGDWIIRGVSGEVYPCKPDIFEKTYEKVGEERE